MNMVLLFAVDVKGPRFALVEHVYFERCALFFLVSSCIEKEFLFVLFSIPQGIYLILPTLI